MDLHSRVSYAVAKLSTNYYSSSFSMSSRFFDSHMRAHIYNIYGLVRLADEIVDTYMGKDAGKLLDQLENETYAAISRGYSTNYIVHAFAVTAREYTIAKDIIEPFFASMRIDLAPQTYTDELYETYIHGSAEVVGLMCLRVFCAGDGAQYDELKNGAEHLGAAYQKINFLRDLASDKTQLNRFYFPGCTFETFSDDDKNAIVADTRHDLDIAEASIRRLPKRVRIAVGISSQYYATLLRRLERASVREIKQKRFRVSGIQKALLAVPVVVKELFS